MRVFILVILSVFVLIGRANPDRDIPIIDSLEKVVVESKDPKTLIHSYSQLCWILRSNDPENAIIYGNKALQLINKFPDLDSLRAQTLNYLGVVNRNKGDYTIALNYYFDALKNAEKHNNNIQQAYSNNNIGGIFTLRGDYLNAINYLEKALHFFEKENDNAGMGYACINLGNLYRHTNEAEEGLQYFDRAIAYKKLANDTIGIGIALNLKAITYFNSNKFSEAHQLYKQLESIYKHNKDEKGLSVVYNHLGLIEIENENYLKGKNYFLAALDIVNQIDYKGGKAYSSLNLGLASYKLGNIQEAFKQLEFGYNLSSEIGDLEIIKTSYERYTKIYYGLGDYKKAYEYQLKLQETIDKANSNESRERMASLRINNELDKKISRTEYLENQNKLLEQNIKLSEEKIMFRNYFVISLVILILIIFIPLAILFRKNKNRFSHNEELKLKNLELQDANETRERFLSIIGHDLKNPFNSVLGLASLLVEEWDSIPSEEKRQIVNEIQISGNSIFELMDNLLLWAKNQSHTLQLHQLHFDINEYVVEVYEIFRNQATFKGIQMQLNIGTSNNVFADPNMISTVLRNLVSNALKFTRKGGRILIEINKRSSEVEFSISDNGKGIPPEDLKRILDENNGYSTKGTANETGTGLGLLIVKDFIKKNNGVFWVESKMGEGSRFCFTLPEIKQ